MTINSLSLQTGGIYPPEIGQTPIPPKCFTPNEAKEYVLKNNITVFIDHFECLKRYRDYFEDWFPHGLEVIVYNYANGNHSIDEALIKYCLSCYPSAWELIENFLEKGGCIVAEETVIPMIISNKPPEYILKKILERNISPHILRNIPRVISLYFGVDTLKTLIEKEVIDFTNNTHSWTDLKNEECALYVLERYPTLDRNDINLAVKKKWVNVLQKLLESNVTIPSDALRLVFSKQFNTKKDKVNTIRIVDILVDHGVLFNENSLYYFINLSIKAIDHFWISKALDIGIKPDASSLRHCVDRCSFEGVNIILSRNPELKPSFIELEPMICKNSEIIEFWVNVFVQNELPISDKFVYKLAFHCKNPDFLSEALRISPHADRSIVFKNLCLNWNFQSPFIDVLDTLLKQGATFDELTEEAEKSANFLTSFQYSALIHCIRKGWLPPENIICKVILIYFTFADGWVHDNLAELLTSRLFKNNNLDSKLINCAKEIYSLLKQLYSFIIQIKNGRYDYFLKFIDFYEREIKSQILDTYENHMRWGLTPQAYWSRVYARERLHVVCQVSQYFDQLDGSPIYSLSSYGLNVVLYNELLPIMKKASERENNPNFALHAYKLAVLFVSKEEVESYLENYRLKYPRSIQPVHDACLFELPSNGFWSVPVWRLILKRVEYHKKWMNLLPLASEIENYLYKALTPYPTLQSQGLTRDEIHEKYYEEIKVLEKTSQKSVFELFTIEYNEFKKWKEKQKEGKRKNVQDTTNDTVRVDSDHIASVPATSAVRKDSTKIERGDFIKFIIKNSDKRNYYREIIALEKASQKSVFELFEEEYEKFSKWKESKKKGKRKNVHDRTSESIRVDSDHIASVSASSIVSTDSKNFERGDFINFLIKNSDISRLTYDQIIALYVRIHYGDAPDEYKPFAFECVRCGVTRDEFDKVLTIMQQRSGEKKFVPDVLIKGEDLGFPEFRLEKMKDTDPMIALAGYKTGCCQNISGAGRGAAYHALASPYGGIYRIMKEDVWVAQAWTALTANNELLFDSIEWNLIFKEEMVLAFFDAAARAVLRDNPMIKRVLCGSGGNTPKQHSYPLQHPDARSKIIGYVSFGYDSRERFIMADRQQLAESSTSSTSVTLQYIESKGIDTFLNLRSKVYQPAQHPFARSYFRETHPRATEILKHPKNPLVEEGFCRPESFEDRDHYGEHFIPMEGVKRIINGKIAEKNYPVTYRSFIANDLIQLIDFLSSISLSEGENALIVYVDGVHAVPVYLESKDSQSYAVMIDSEGTPKGKMNDVAGAIVRRFPDIKLIQNLEKIQLDFYSCNTCAIKVMLYFAKHGLKLLQSIQFEENPNSYYLDFTTLPIELLKFHQKPEKLAQLFDRVVKPRTSETLGDYFERNALKGKTRNYNLALIKKRDRYLDDLERICQMNDGVHH